MRHEIINDINLTLRDLLKEELKGVFKNVGVKLADLENFKKGETKTGMNIFPYAITINEPGFRTKQGVKQVKNNMDGTTIYVFHPRPVPITISYMVTPFATDAQTEYQLLGRVIQVLQENAMLSGDRLRGDWLPTQEKISFTPDYGFSVDRQLELFRAYDVSFKMSVGYLARAYMDSDKVVRKSKIARGVRHGEGPDEQAPDG